VRSGTDNPCVHPAMVKVKVNRVPFCEPYAREQEAHFAIGELRALDPLGPYHEAGQPVGTQSEEVAGSLNAGLQRDQVLTR
jgi:hypothetical protein